MSLSYFSVDLSSSIQLACGWQVVSGCEGVGVAQLCTLTMAARPPALLGVTFIRSGIRANATVHAREDCSASHAHTHARFQLTASFTFECVQGLCRGQWCFLGLSHPSPTLLSQTHILSLSTPARQPTIPHVLPGQECSQVAGPHNHAQAHRREEQSVHPSH